MNQLIHITGLIVHNGEKVSGLSSLLWNKNQTTNPRCWDTPSLWLWYRDENISLTLPPFLSLLQHVGAQQSEREIRCGRFHLDRLTGQPGRSLRLDGGSEKRTQANARTGLSSCRQLRTDLPLLLLRKCRSDARRL